MANKNNSAKGSVNKNAKNTNKKAVKTETKNTAATVENSSTEMKRKRRTKIIAIVLSAVLLAAIVIGLVIIINNRNKTLDYMNDNLSKYVSISKDDYTGFKVTVDVPMPTEEELTAAINKVLYNNRTTPEGELVWIKNADISLGDVVNIYCRGYTFNEDGSRNYLASGCNYNSNAPTALGIGSGTFPAGFETGLIGLNQKNYATMDKISVTGTAVQKSDTILITYNVMYGDGSKGSSVKSAIIDLTDPDLDKTWGTGFSEYWQTHDVNIGTKFSIPVSSSVKEGASANDCYTDVSVSEIYRINNEKPVLTINAQFPYNYEEESLRGKKVYYTVFIINLQRYNAPTLDEQFITETLKISENDLVKYDGGDIVAKYKNSVYAELVKEREQAIEEVVANAFWAHIVEVAEYKRLPKAEVDAYYDNLYQQLQSIYTQYQTQGQFSSFDEFAVYYMGLTEGEDWQSTLRADAETSIKQKLAFYYVIREEGFIPNDEEYQELYDEMFAEAVEYYVNNYSMNETDAKATVEKTYDEEYWDLQVIFTYGIKKICGLADVTNTALKS